MVTVLMAVVMVSVVMTVPMAVGMTVIVPIAVIVPVFMTVIVVMAAVAMVVVAVAVIQARIVGGGTHLVGFEQSDTSSRGKGTSPFTERRIRASFLTSLSCCSTASSRSSETRSHLFSSRMSP